MSIVTGKADYTKYPPTEEDDIIRELGDWVISQASADELQTYKARYME